MEEGACLGMKNIGKPCTGKPYALFDEGGLAYASSLLYPIALQQLARLIAVNIMQRRNILELFDDFIPVPKRKITSNPNQLCLTGQ